LLCGHGTLFRTSGAFSHVAMLARRLYSSRRMGVVVCGAAVGLGGAALAGRDDEAAANDDDGAVRAARVSTCVKERSGLEGG
jgi:hypothetical protein